MLRNYFISRRKLNGLYRPDVTGSPQNSMITRFISSSFFAEFLRILRYRGQIGQTSSYEHHVENNGKAFKLIQCIKKGEFNERSLDDFRTMLDSSFVAWTDIAIKDIRVLQKEIKKCSFGLNKRNPESKFFVALESHLSLEERRRPIDEQFPFVRTDLDQLSTITESLAKTTKFLDNAGLNRSREMEVAVNALFVEEMKKKDLPIISIVSTDQSKYTGVELTVKKGEHIQWDGMYAVIDCHGEYKQATIFLIETKEIANARDIFENENNLSDKVTKTLRYLEQRKQPSKGDKRPTDKDLVDIQKEQVASFLKVPLDGVENSTAPKIVVIYASGNMPSHVVEKLVKLRDKFEGKVNVWSMECPRLTMCQINDV